GLFDAGSLAWTGLPLSEFNPGGLEFWGKINFLKAGLSYSDALSTVSPTYAREIMTRYEFGFGLEGLLEYRRSRLKGILNGLDTKLWNPKTDPNLAQNFDEKSLAKRAAAKTDLQRTASFNADKKSPLLGFVGRFDRQKGISFIVESAHLLLKQNIQMVFL